MTLLTDHVVFNDKKLSARFANGKIPMSTLFEAYLDGDIDIPDMDAFLEARQRIVSYTLTKHHAEFLFTRFIPEVAIHSKSQDERIVREHYDRGDDFFEAFLGERMVYTAGWFRDEAETLEQGQDNKVDLVCKQAHGAARRRDARHRVRLGHARAARGEELRREEHRHHDQQEPDGVRQCAHREGRPRRQGANRVPRLPRDPRPQVRPHREASRWSSTVGVKNLSKYCSLVYELLKDDGVFFLQFCGLRRGAGKGVPVIGLRPEDPHLGPLREQVHLPRAPTPRSPLSDMVKALEKAGFDIQSAENVSIHYSMTIRKWHQNWQKHRDTIVRSYGERWYRLWHLFLGWSWRIGAQGNAACFQVVAHKNLDSFDRKVFVGRSTLAQVRGADRERERPATASGAAHAE